MSHPKIFTFFAAVALVVALSILATTSFAVTPFASRDKALKFAVPQSAPVAMRFSYSSHYQIGTAEGADEFAKLVPAKGHMVYIDDDSSPPVARPYTVTLFHQMKCLDLLREQYISESPRLLKYTAHCLNYLRQTILCRPNLRIESAKNINGTASRTYDAACNDWTAVYQEAERNQEAFQTRSAS